MDESVPSIARVQFAAEASRGRRDPGQRGTQADAICLPSPHQGNDVFVTISRTRSLQIEIATPPSIASPTSIAVPLALFHPTIACVWTGRPLSVSTTRTVETVLAGTATNRSPVSQPAQLQLLPSAAKSRADSARYPTCHAPPLSAVGCRSGHEPHASSRSFPAAAVASAASEKFSNQRRVSPEHGTRAAAGLPATCVYLLHVFSHSA